ncbi:MAG: hypothetical protein NC543_15010 [bacterium]|nr:hypothetical protein [bacterium]MCM1373467.1 hypothetical protein [Muribaculum sp.]
MKHSKSSLFLMELIIALLFFSLASTVCIRLFVNAHSLSSQTVDMNYAVNYAQNMAETFTGCDGDLTSMQAILSGSLLSQEGDSLSMVQNGYCIYLTRAGAMSPGSMISADISVYRQDALPLELQSAAVTPDAIYEPLYTLHIDLHIPHVK